jgi:hypothetical protein
MAKKPEPAVEPTPEQPVVKEEPRARQGSAPFCPYHRTQRCESNNSTPVLTRYYCPLPDCTFSIKVPRPNAAKEAALTEPPEDFSAR